MDEPKPAEPTTPAATDTPKPASSGAVMDVVAPPPVEKTEDAASASDKPVNAPAPAADQPASDVAQEPGVKADDKPVKPAKTKTPRGPNVKLAIIATVIIVLGLAVLATYAYIQSK